MMGDVRDRARSGWLAAWRSLGFVPAVIVVVFAVVGIALVELDKSLELSISILFSGDGSAARTLLSVLAGSLITVAGLTFSITIVVLQLASSQFSPRTLPTFFTDRITQVTIGVYVGTFVYSILVLRSVGSFGDAEFVPRLSVTVASLLGIGAVILLIAFLHHVSQLIQVSHLTANITRETLKRIEDVYPEPYGEPPGEEPAADVAARWRQQDPGKLLPPRPGYVRWVGLDGLAETLSGRSERAAVLVCPGDFVSVDGAILEVWPPEVAERCREKLLGSIAVADERDLTQDVDFGIRQLADTAIKALSPGINDPITAVTSIRYLRSILVRLAQRAEPRALREFPDHGVTLLARHRSYSEHLDPLLQVNRFVDGDALVAEQILDALAACARAAGGCGATQRVAAIAAVADEVAARAVANAGSALDRHAIERSRAAVPAVSRAGLG